MNKQLAIEILTREANIKVKNGGFENISKAGEVFTALLVLSQDIVVEQPPQTKNIDAQAEINRMMEEQMKEVVEEDEPRPEIKPVYIGDKEEE